MAGAGTDGSPVWPCHWPPALRCCVSRRRLHGPDPRRHCLQGPSSSPRPCWPLAPAPPPRPPGAHSCAPPPCAPAPPPRPFQGIPAPGDEAPGCASPCRGCPDPTWLARTLRRHRGPSLLSSRKQPRLDEARTPEVAKLPVGAGSHPRLPRGVTGAWDAGGAPDRPSAERDRTAPGLRFSAAGRAERAGHWPGPPGRERVLLCPTLACSGRSTHRGHPASCPAELSSH